MSRRINSSQVKAYRPPITGNEYPRDKTNAADVAADRCFEAEPGSDAARVALDEYIRLRADGECVADLGEDE